MKKIAIMSLLVTMLAGTMSLNVFAHGGCGRRNYAQKMEYQTCQVYECAEQGLHEHDGTYYNCANYDTGCCKS